LQGDERSEDARFGGHVLSNGKVARFSGVLGYRMGQRNVLARYPFHFHLMGVSRDSYITDCSVWHSYYRAVTVHGTNETLVAR
jgi:cell surface hyaluronidase